MTRNIPPGVATRLATFFGWMRTRGVVEDAQIYGFVPVYDQSGKAVGKQDVLLVTLSAYYESGGGSVELSTEGLRNASRDRIYFLDDPTGNLDETNKTERRVVLPGRSPMKRRIAELQGVGPYVWADLEVGGTADVHGNAR